LTIVVDAVNNHFSMSDKPLTDLEGAVLAEIAKRGVATSYVVARVFADSPSEFWSGSAGAVYPLTKRLAARGMLTAMADADGKRTRLDYRLTEAGRVAMEAWLLDGERAAGMGFDPLRTRMVYLDLVSPEKRRNLLAEVRARHEAASQKSIWEDKPISREVHLTWMANRAGWLRVLDFIWK
jgi:DNA-binding PadR family transcriptional regulator